MDGEHDGAKSARRRRERRLRSWWRHERQSVAMALSAAVNHSFDKVAAEVSYSSLRAQNTERAEAAHNAPRRQTSGAARVPQLFQLFEEWLSGAWPTTLVEPPQMVDQLRDALRLLDSPMAEQVVAVPKISSPSHAGRTALREPQIVEQFVEVTTLLTSSFIQQ